MRKTYSRSVASVDETEKPSPLPQIIDATAIKPSDERMRNRPALGELPAQKSMVGDG